MARFSRIAAFVLVVLALAGVGQRADAAPPTFSGSFTPNSVGEGATSLLTFTIDNSLQPEVSNLGFSVALPLAGGQMSVADNSAASTCSGGTLTAPSGATSITYSAGETVRDSVCTVTVNVTAPTAGTYTIPAITLSSTAGNSTPSTSFDLTVIAPPATPNASFGFVLSDASLFLGETTTATYTMTNISAGRIGAISFAHTLPAGVSVANPPNAVTTCEPTGFGSPFITATSGSQNISFSLNGSSFSDLFAALIVGESCQVSVDLTASSTGVFALTPGKLDADTQDIPANSQTLTVDSFVAPVDEITISKSFAAASVAPGGTIDLTFVLSNANPADAATNITFTDDLDAFLTGAVANGLPQTDICGTGSSVAGTSTLTLSGGTIPARSTCSFTVTVQVPAAAAAGTYTNTTSGVQADIGGTASAGSDTATDTLTVLAAQPLQFTRAFNPDSVAGGDPLTLEYTITNPNGAAAASAITFEENFSSRFGNLATFTSANVTNCGAGATLSPVIISDFTGSTLVGFTFSGGDLAAGASCIFSASSTVPVDAASGAFVSTSGDLSATFGGAPVTTPGQTDTLIVNGGASVNISAQVQDTLDGLNNGRVMNGDQFDLVYLLESLPESTSTATNVAFSVDVSDFAAGTIAVIQANTCTQPGATATMSAGDTILNVAGVSLAPDEDCAVTLRVTAAGGTNATVSATTSNVTYSAAGNAGETSGVEASIIFGDVTPLIWSHSFGGTPALAGDAITLTYDFENPNSFAVTGTFFTHNLNAVISGLASTGVASDGCGFTTVTGTTFVIANGATIAAGASCSLVLNLQIPGGAATGDYASETSSLNATYGAAGPLPEAPSLATLSVDNEPIVLTKEFLDDPVAPGGTVSVRYTVENPLATPLTGIGFSAVLDPGLGGAVATGLPQSNVCGAGSSIGGTGTITLGGGSIPASGSCSFTVTVQIPGGAGDGSYPHTTSALTATAGGSPVGADPASDTLEVSSAADTVFNANFAGTALVGGTTSITYTINNPGSGTLGGLAFTHDLDATVTGLVATGLPANDVCGAGSAISGSGFLTLTGGSLGPGEQCVIVVNLQVPATASAGAFPSVTSDLTNNGLKVADAASDTLDVDAAADLSVTKTDGAGSVIAGQSTTYTIVARNDGPSADPAAMLSDAVPANASSCSYTSVAAGGASGNTASGTGALSETLNLPNGGSVTYTMTCTVPASATGTLVNTASIATSGGVVSLNAANNSATDTNTITSSSDLSVTMSDNFDPVFPTGTVGYTIQVSNAGPSDATGVSASFTLPAGLTLSSTSGCGEDPNGVPTCTLGNLSAGANTSFTVNASVDNSTTGTVTPSVTISSAVTDPVAGNNSASESTTVTPLVAIDVLKTDNVTSATPGQTVTYTMRVTNGGPSIDPSVSVSDTFPAGLICDYTSTPFGGATGNSSATGASAISDTLSMPANSFVNYSAVCSIPANATGTLSNTMTATASLTELNTANNSATDNDTVLVGSADLSVTLTDSPDPVDATQNVTFSGRVSNAGPSDATGVAASINLPAGLTLVSTSGCAEDPNAVPTCTLGTITAGSFADFTVVAQAPGLAPSAGITTASVSSAVADPVAGNNTASQVTTVSPVAAISVTKSAPATIFAGETLVYRINVSNAGPSTDPSVSFTDTFPTGLSCSYTSVASGGASGNTVSGSGNLSETLLLPSGGAVAYTANCVVPASMTPQSLTNTATATPSVTDNTASDNSASASTSVGVGVDVSVGMTQDNATRFVGETVIYTVNVANAGPSDLASVDMVATLPPGLDFGTLSGCTPTMAPGLPVGARSCRVSNLAAGTNQNIVFSATANGMPTGAQLVTVSATAVGATEADASDNSASLTTTVNPLADIAVTKTDGVTRAIAGTSVTYTIVATNNGPSPDPAVSLTDTFPADLTCSYTSAASGGATGNTAAGSGDLSETLNMPAASSVTYTATCNIDPAATATLSNTASVAASVSDPVPGNDSATDNDTTLVQNADLNVTLTDAVDPVNAGDSITYNVQVSNAGPSVATSTNATFSVPAGLTLVSTLGCAEDPSAVPTCSLGTIAPGGSASYTVVVGGTGRASGTVAATVLALSDAADPVIPNSSVLEETTITPVADISITKTDNVTAAVAGQSVTYVIDVANAGPSQAPSVLVADNFDSNTTCTYTAVADRGATGAAAGSGNLNQTLLMPAGSSVRYTAQCAIDADFVGTLSNTATATSSILDLVLANNSATDNDTVVSAQSDLSVTKTDGVTSVISGQSVTYTIIAANAGPSDDPAATLTDTFPTGLSCSYASTASGGATGNTASGAGNISDTLSLPSGGSVTYTASCLVDPNATGTLSNTATIAASTLDPVPGNNSATDADTAITPLTFGFTKVFSPTSVNVGQNATLTLTIDNTSNALAATGLAFTDPLPAGMVLAADPAASNSCNGTLTAVGGASSLGLSGGSVNGGQSCSISVQVTTSQDGSLANTTTVLTSNFPDAGPATANLAVNPAGAPVFVKAFTPTRVQQGQTSSLTFGIDNTANAVAATGMSFTDTFPAGMVVAPVPNVASDCGGTLTATAGAGSVSLTGGTVAALSSCTISVDVRATASGALANVSGDLTSDLPTATGPSATLTSNAAQMLFSKAFAASSIEQGTDTTLTFTIDNSGNAINATVMAFSDPLTSGLVVASVPNVVNDCGGTVTAVAGSTSIALTGGALAENASCTISVDVTGTVAGTVSNTTSILTSSLADVPAASDTLTVNAPVAPGFAKAFVPASITQGETTVLTFTLDNTNFIDAQGLAFTDPLPAGLVVAAAPAVSNTCGGTFAPAAGDTTLSFSGASLAARSQCSASVTLRALGENDVTNVTSVLSSTTVPDAAPATAVLTIAPAAAPGFAKAFTPAAVTQGEETTLSFTIDNSANAIEATSLAFNDPFPAGLVVADSPNVVSDCTGGTVTAQPGAATVSYSGGTIAEGASCTIAVNVRAIGGADLVNTTSALTSSLADAAAASATLTVTAADAPGFAKSFSPASIAQGETSTLTLTIDNSGNAILADDLAFTDSFPSGMVLADTPATTNTCGGTLSGVAGDAAIGLTGGTVAAGADCAITVVVRALSAGDLVNTTSTLSSTLATADAATATLSVAPAGAPGFAKSFDDPAIAQGEETTLNFTIDNSANAIEATTIAFTDPFPAGLVVADSPNASNSCGGTFTAVAGADSVDLTGASLDAGQDCALSVAVRAVGDGTLDNVTSALTSSLADASPATARLSVAAAAAPVFSKTFTPDSIAQGETSTLTLVIDNSANAILAGDMAFDDVFPAGMITADTPNATNTCNGTLTSVAGGASVSLSAGSVAAGATCSITVDVRAVGAGALDNVTTDLTSTLATAAPATATLTVADAAAPGFAKSFAPANVAQGETSVLSFTIDNSANAILADDLAFQDIFPAGMIVANDPGASNTCGGVLTAVAGAGSVSLSGATLPEASSCTLSVNVRAIGTGNLDNVTSELTSTLASATPATATLAVSSATAPGYAMSFAPDSIAQGQGSTLRFVIDNAANAIEAASLAFGGTLPVGLEIAAVPNATNSCGGTVAALAGDSGLSLTGGTVGAGAVCEVTVDVVSTGFGTLSATGSELTSTLATAAAISADITVSQAQAPGFTKSYGSATLSQGQTTTLTYVIDNAANSIEATDLGFADQLPGALQVVGTVTNTCGGTLSAPAGGTAVTLTGGQVDAGASCTIIVTVQAISAGSLSTTAPVLTSSLPSATAVVSDPVIVVVHDPLDVAMSFAPATIEQDQVSTLTYTLTNSAVIGATDVTLSDSLPANLGILSNPAPATTCSGSLGTTASGVSLTGGTLAAGASCTITVRVSSVIVGTYDNTTDSVTSSLGNSAPASASLRVERATTGTVTIVQLSDTDGAYGFASSEPLLSFTINVSDGVGQHGPVQVSTGSYLIRQTTPGGVGNTEIRCNDTDSSGDAFNRTLTVNVAPLETVVCTIVSISTRQKTVETINSFLTKRADLILSSEPNNARRFDRLRRGYGNADPMQFANGDLKSFLPFTAKVDLESQSYALKTSLLQMRQAGASLALAHGSTKNTLYVDNYRWDAWFEAKYKRFNQGENGAGHFGVAYFGVDYLVTPDLLVGAVLQFDDMEDINSENDTTARGTGWMFGPYVTARLTEGLYFDGRIAFGKSLNEVSPFNTYTDEFETTRWLVQGALTGEFKHGLWTIRPNASLSYYEETQKAYTDSLNVGIPSQTIKLGQIQLGPTFNGNFEMANGALYAPYFGFDATYNFGETTGVTLTGDSSNAAVNGWRAGVKAGLQYTGRSGTRLSIGGTYDGIGQPDYETWGLELELSIPLGRH